MTAARPAELRARLSDGPVHTPLCCSGRDTPRKEREKKALALGLARHAPLKSPQKREDQKDLLCDKSSEFQLRSLCLQRDVRLSSLFSPPCAQVCVFTAN